MYATQEKAEAVPLGQVPDEMKDRHASRLRAEGMSFREIAEAMQTDVAMAHRRVKRGQERQRCEHELRMQTIREQELTKLGRLENAIIADAYQGDLNALRLVLRIMAMRLRLLKDVSCDTAQLADCDDLLDGEQADAFPGDAPAPEAQTAPDAESEQPSCEEGREAPRESPSPTSDLPPLKQLTPRQKDFATLLALESSQPELAKDLASIMRASTDPSTDPSTPRPTRQARRRAAREEKKRAKRAARAVAKSSV